MRASVIIVSYNSREYLSGCLPSLIPSLGQQDEIIIVDNASSDNTSPWLIQQYPEIHLIRSNQNLGYAGGNNLGAKHAHGKYLVFLNPDTIVDKNWLDSLINVLDNNPKVGLATSKIFLLQNPQTINTCGNDVHISGITLCRGMNQPSNLYSKQEEVSAVSGAAFAIRTDLFNSLGGFDESFFMYMEDTDLSWRARLNGALCMFVPHSLVHHAYSLQFGTEKVFYQERNRYMLLIKTLKAPTLILLIPVFVLSELISWGFAILRDRSNLKNKIDAYTWIINNWSNIKEKRLMAQSNRKISDHILLQQTSYKLDFFQTGKNLISIIAHVVFTPIFWVLRLITLVLVKW